MQCSNKITPKIKCDILGGFMKPAIVALGSDLIFAVRIGDAARRAGYQFANTVTVEDVMEAAERLLPEWVVIDLAFDPRLDAISALKANSVLRHLKTIGYLPHVDFALRDRAESAGFDHVFARSKFVTEFPRLLSCATA